MPLRTLRLGMNGPDVKALQQALNTWNGNKQPPLVENGVFNAETDHAVRAFQAAHGLLADGAVGRDTRAALFPHGVATVAVYGMRLRLPDPPHFVPPLQRPTLLPGRLHLPDGLPSLLDGVCRAALDTDQFEPLRLPRVPFPVPAPVVPDWNFTIPPLPGAPPSRPLGFVYDHVELQPGAQSTFPFRGRRQDAFTLTMQTVYRRGPDDGAHQEADLGVQIGTPLLVQAPGGPWTFNPYVTLTDVDRFGVLGQFHYWQPYAQLGAQFSGPGDPQPTLTANLFPINLGLDIGDLLTLSLGGGLAVNLDLRSGQVQAGPQLTIGLSLKMGRATGPL